jgi:endonuclease/exonuclease/phosphatase family metal-dependent hydrolase
VHRTAGELRLATYNVKGRLWHPAGRSLGVVERVLEEIDADVVALQELHPPPSLPERWEDSAGVVYHVVYGPTLMKRRRAFGNALLSRHPIREVRRVDLSRPRREPRGALDVTIAVAELELRVVATHLGLRSKERAAQVARLLEHCGDMQGLVALMGDINEWSARGAALRVLERCLGASPRVASFPSRWPFLALDRVWVRPSAALARVVSHGSALARRASDHLPVVATLSAPAHPGGSGPPAGDALRRESSESA